MHKYCPIFVLECAATYICEKFLFGTLPLEIFCKKICEYISTEYKELSTQDVYEISENFLRVLSEGNIDDANAVLRSYAYERLSYTRNGKDRNWKSILFSPLKGNKKNRIDLKSIRINFQAYVFRHKHKQNIRMPEDWEIKNSNTSDFLKLMGSMEFSPFDILKT